MPIADRRNVTDEFKDQPLQDIVAQLDQRGVSLEIAIENTLRDFNMGTIVRSANAFGVRHIHIVGRRQWNKRGAMATEKYLHLHYWESAVEFAEAMRSSKKTIVAVDNTPGAVDLHAAKLPPQTVLLFGQEGPGLSEELLAQAWQVVAIEQLGSTRSINVGVAAGIVMYAWLNQNIFQ